MSVHQVGVTTSGTTTPVDLPSPPKELHEVPLPPAPFPKLPELPGITDLNRQTEALCQRIIEHNRSLRELPLTPHRCLEALLAHIWPGENLDEVAFTEGNITYRQLRRIDQSSNPHLYTKTSLLEGTDYQPPRFQDAQSEGEEEEEGEVKEEHPLPIPEPLGTHLEIPHSEHNSPEQFSERLRESLHEHLGTIIEATFQLPESLESD